MGRRVTATTKGGKFMNPTDQARKEARRRELRKNKKQRLAVRQAVIKTKDPRQMLAELETLDEMELNPTENLPYNDKVVKEKRIKLLENVERITNYYLREDPEHGNELRTLLHNYRKDRLKKEVYYESVRNAQRVKIDSIPLPDAPFTTPQLSDIPLPGLQPQGILKKPVAYSVTPVLPSRKEPPGPPPGPPPLKKKFKGNKVVYLQPRPPPGPPPMDQSVSKSDEKDAYDPEDVPAPLGEDESDDDKSDDEFQHRDEDYDGDAAQRKRRHSKDADSSEDDAAKQAKLISESSGITPLQAMMLKLAGQSMPAKQAATDEAGSSTDDQEGEGSTKVNQVAKNQQNPPPGPPPGLPPGPPGLPPDIAAAHLPPRIVPPGPPPGMPHALPPGPPPGLPPTLPMRMNMNPPANIRSTSKAGGDSERHPTNPQSDAGAAHMGSGIFSAPPSLIHHRQEKEKEGMPTMIVAKPKIISNPKADVTRFMPTSLRVKRQNIPKANKPADKAGSSLARQHVDKAKTGRVNADVAYDSFMREMQGLL